MTIWSQYKKTLAEPRLSPDFLTDLDQSSQELGKIVPVLDAKIRSIVQFQFKENFRFVLR